MTRNADLKRLFHDTFGFPPHGFQQRVAAHLISGRNVLLQAPTGAGKTEAALFPFLLARQDGLDFPRKLLYVVPMRVLAKSFHDRVTNSPNGQRDGLTMAIQTGEQQDDRQLRSNVIFTTIDQALSSFLNIPYSLGLRQGNVNAGAVVSSYLVFDEFHLFGPDTAMPTTIQMLKMLNGIAPFLLMTATFSEPLIERLGEWLTAEVVQVSRCELAKIPSQQNKQRMYRIFDTALVDSVDAVIDQHQTRSLVICNTVARAQEMYRQLCGRLQGSQTGVLLLHSRFLKDDRKCKEDEVRKRFGKDAAKQNIILVATQVIEVGLDITCETLHTEVAPASAIFQRAGRCARFKDESGTVVAYPTPMMDNGQPNYHPYVELQDVCAATFTAFQERNGSVIDFSAEQEVINEVHGESDREILCRLSALPTHSKMSECIGGLKREMARELIRQNDSVSLLIHESPELLIDPFRAEGFSLYRGSVFGQWRLLREQAQARGLDWVFKYPVEAEDDAAEKSANTRGKPTYRWNRVSPDEDLRTLPSVLFAVHPRLAGYDSDIGFRFETDGVLQLPERAATSDQEPQTFTSRYYRETYKQHIGNLLAAYERELRDGFSFAATRLEAKLDLPCGTIDRAVRLCLALHDVGKLTVGWQRWAHEWQTVIGQAVDGTYMVAHTDYDASNPMHRAKERELAFRKISRPSHAGEGMRAVAFVLTGVFGQDAEDLIKAALTAVARHHSPRTDKFGAYVLHTAATSELTYVLNMIDDGALAHLDKLTLTAQPEPLTNAMVQPADTLPLLTYFLIVRALRLADQCATEQASRGGE